MADAISTRTRFGLRADVAWIQEAAADPDSQIGMNEFGIPLTPNEFGDLMSRRWDENLFHKVRAYGLGFPDDFAGAYINLEGSGVVIEFKGPVERHRKALSKLVADPALVEVQEVEWSLSDLEGFMEEVEADAAWFAAVGVRFLQVGHPVDENVVVVDFIGPTAETESLVEAYFGHPTWLKARVSLPPWSGPRADLQIQIRDPAGKPVPNIRCNLEPQDPRAESEFSDSLFGTGPAGSCDVRNIPAIAYRVSLHRWVDNDHYDPKPIDEFGIVVTPGGTVVPVTIPTR